MKVAIDVSPLKTGNFLSHRVRGTGFYIKNLLGALNRFSKDNEFIEFWGNQIPKDAQLVHYPYFEPFFLSLPSKKTKKTVVTVHDLTPLVFPKEFPAGIRGRLKWQMQKRRLQKADAIITDSLSSKKDIERLVGKKVPIHVVYLAADKFKKIRVTKEEEKRILERYSLPEQFALYVGDATWNKNLPRLLKAVEDLPVTLAMAGKALVDESIDFTNPWNKDLLAVQKKAKEMQNVKLLGFVSNEDLLLLYNLATIFVMPSLYEGFGLPLLEAMSCGVACIASKEGSLPEIGGNAVCYIDAYSVEDMRQAIQKLLENNSKRGELSEEELKQVKKFSWEKTARETVKVYEKIYS